MPEETDRICLRAGLRALYWKTHQAGGFCWLSSSDANEERTEDPGYFVRTDRIKKQGTTKWLSPAFSVFV
ncbi:hypothetical protein CLOSTMETH_02086 [[Clostridium] methylpentosum DSM 5476]|uniref:Uncharacterized protein n=1 Tax=[Clostridium] methylpentosum DSM 5476 TaxID=537013 RepID=C0EE07_9FIRM|nr:hypothetical protein CLOSTMETH_02086 [[Clostridium] methylpentosum DSM 5476]